MRSSFPYSLGSALLLGLAATAHRPAADAAPVRAAEPAAAAKVAKPDSEAPLVAGELADDLESARALYEHYTKYEYRIPMRDGVHLFTVAYVPKERSRTYPILITRTPYSCEPYGVDNYPDGKRPRSMGRVAPSRLYVREGYILACQDVRGRFMSEGHFVDVRPHAGKGGIDESTDAWDTIDWLVKNVPGSSGKVGIWGSSYPGFYAAQAAVDAHPALAAASPQAPVTDWFVGDDFHHNGALFLAQAFDFYASFGKPRPKPVRKSDWGFDYDAGDAYDFFLNLGALSHVNERYFHGEIAFWNDILSHGTRDAFWQARDPRPYYKNTRPAVLTVGGWFDAEDLWGALQTYRAFSSQSPAAEVSLVMGPWRHGGWLRTDGDHLGDVRFGAKTSQYYAERIEFPFFQKYLKGRAGGRYPERPGAWVFETGVNLWQHYPSWPPPQARSQALYFHAGQTLSTRPPAAGEDAAGADAYLSDPLKPVPYRDKPAPLIDADYMVGDQRFAARRPDVLVYQTEPLGGDVTLGGPLSADLVVTVSGTDADFVVKLIDVYPPDVADPEPNPAGVRLAGYQQLVRAEIMRARFRNGFEHPTALLPGEVTPLRFGLPDVNHTFRAGHRIMVQVQSSWFPLVDRNPQTFVDIYAARDSDFRPATHRVLRTPAQPSSLKVTVVRGQLP
jgi:putative CocE/NonD family hydrolase